MVMKGALLKICLKFRKVRRKIKGQDDEGQQGRTPPRGESASKRVSERTAEMPFAPFQQNSGAAQNFSKAAWRSEKAFRIRRFMLKFLGVSLLSSASKKGRTWEHGPGTPYKLLSSRSFSERLERSEKAFRKRRFISKILGVFLFCFRGKKERTREHKARTT